VTASLVVDTVGRVLHLAAACTSLGGLFYARMVLWPSLERVPVEGRAAFLGTVIRRYAAIKWTGMSVVSLTGLHSLWRVWPTLGSPGPYLAAFGLKMLGALGLFVITLQLALPLPSLAGMQRRRGFFAGLNIGCAAVILVGAAMMRAVRAG